MSSFAEASRRFLRRLVRPDRRPAATGSGTAAVLDGLTAVAVTESIGSESVVLGAGDPATAGVEAWRDHLRHHHVNCFDEPLSGVEAATPRGAVETAIGLALSGQRATAFCSGADLAAANDLLPVAAGRHVPLVLHLACRAPATHAAAHGSGHESYHGASDAGLLQLFAVNVQEAIDLALIARYVTDRALVPAIVAMDGEQTALAAQDVLLPDPAIVRAYLGDPSEHIASPTPAQRMLFGDVRRLVPRWFDGDRPLMLGSHQGPESWGLGTAAHRAHFTAPVDEQLMRAFEQFAEIGGRSYAPLLEHRVEDAKFLLVAQGSAVETAMAVAEHLRRSEHLKIGVVGVRCLRPFPGARLAACLAGKTAVAVLERLDAPLAGDGPLLRELRAALDRACENDRSRGAAHPAYPSLRAQDRPRLMGVPYGLGGLPLRAADLCALVRELREPRAVAYLGVEFAPATSAYPKRQARMDELRGDEASLATLGTKSAQAPPDVRPPGSVTVAVHRTAGEPFDGLAGEVATMVRELAGGHVRSRPGTALRRSDEPCTEVVTWSEPALHDPGDDVAIDVSVCALPHVRAESNPAARLVPGGVVLVVPPARAGAIPSALLTAMRSGDASVYALDVDAAELAFEHLLGTVLAVFAQRHEGAPVPTAKLRSTREAALDERPDTERAQRVEAFVAAYESWPRTQPLGADTRSMPATEEPSLPPILRRVDRADQTLDCVAHFWDQVGVLYRTDDTDELFADPYLAVGSTPPRTATMRDATGVRQALPVFDPATCDGSGRLWTTCPDGSVAPVVITPRSLVETGIALVAERGQSAEPLRSVLAKLAKCAARIMAEREHPPVTAGSLLREAFSDACGTMNEQRRASLEECIGFVVEAIGALPIARTPAFFDAAESVAPGTGALFSLAVNPDACRCPDLLLAECTGHGLVPMEQTPTALAAARHLWDLWWRLPEPPADVIERVREHPDVGPLAASMLTRRAFLAMAGGDGAPAGSGQRLALYRALAVAEHVTRGRRNTLLAEIDDLRGRLASRIRELLAQALPSGDLDALAEGLDALGRREVELAALSERLDKAVDVGRVDGIRLGRLVDVARGLADLHWRCSVGRDGFGRATVGVVVTGDATAWTSVYPDNPFVGPVAVATAGEGADFARGLGEGGRRQTVAIARLLRWARLELEQPGEAAHAGSALAHLRFEDLTEIERAHCPPTLLVGDGAAINAAPLGTLLRRDHPVTILALGSIDGGKDPSEQAIAALMTGRAFVAQASLAHPNHFARGFERALAFDGPALVHVPVPDSERDGVSAARLFEQARLAVASRTFPLFSFDPSRGVLGACLDLAGNPSPESTWSHDEHGVVLTAIDVMMTGAGRAVTAEDPQPTPVDAYLMMTPEQRDGRTPYVLHGEGDDAEQRRIDASMIVEADGHLRRWRMLQEIAGIVSPLSAAIRDEVHRERSDEHEAEIARLTEQHEARLAGLRAEIEQDARRRVTSGLLALADHAGPREGAS